MAVERAGLSKYPPGSRVLFVGPPNARKTTGMLTWPREGDAYSALMQQGGEFYELVAKLGTPPPIPQGSLRILSFPGEKGFDTIPRDTPGIDPYVWTVDDPLKTSPSSVVREVERETAKIISGQYGSTASFGGDGIHKLYDWVYAAALDDGLTAASARASWDGDMEGIRGPAYGAAHKTFGRYLTQLLQSDIPYIALSVWEAQVKDDPEDRSRKAPKHTFAALPGQMAQRIVGEVPIVMYCHVTRPNHEGHQTATWQLRPRGKIWGIGAKVPPKLAQNLPNTMPMHFRVLEHFLRGGNMPDAQRLYTLIQEEEAR